MSAISIGQPGDTSTPDVWLFYSLLTQDQHTVTDALAALYYLPENFKLLITGDTQNLPEASHYTELAGRVQYQTKRAQDQAAPLAFEMVLYDETKPNLGETPAVVITKSADKDLEQTSKNNFTVPAGRPDAIASAALTIARSASYELVA